MVEVARLKMQAVKMLLILIKGRIRTTLAQNGKIRKTTQTKKRILKEMEKFVVAFGIH